MQQRHYTSILYFISSVILITLAIQMYWNYKNYQSGKAQLLRDVQTSLDNAVEKYYSNVAKHNTKQFFNLNNDSISNNPRLIALSNNIDSGAFELNSVIIDTKSNSSIKDIQNNNVDSIINRFSNIQIDSTHIQSYNFKDPNGDVKNSFTISGSNKTIVDSLFLKMKEKAFAINDSMTALNLRDNAIKNLTTKIVISLDNANFNKQTVDSLFTDLLKNQHLLSINHTLDFEINPHKKQESKNTDLTIKSTSSLLPEGSILTVGFENILGIVLKRNLLGISLSILLLAAVIASLLHLLRIINTQKQLAVIKNDFISNITHEFNTPLATINAAVDGLLHFNTNNDPIKTKKYLQTSKNQVDKLRNMVQRILEISTLHKEELIIKKEKENIHLLLKKLIDRYKIISPESDIKLLTNEENNEASVDAFHFENAIDTILENALKYGEPPITVILKEEKNNYIISIKDEGQELTKSQAKHIFEQFYRIPKGNTHNVKGFGIGLYYSKTIINKHGGTINVTTQPTTFKITMPYV